MTYGKGLYRGTSRYYSDYRPTYPSTLIRFLVNHFNLDGNGRLLDLGCGPGRLSLRLTDWCDKITGVDQEPEMIEEFKRQVQIRRSGRVDWFTGTLEVYIHEHPSNQFHLVTMAKSFHWMDSPQTLNQLYEVVEPGGAVAIIDNFEPDRQPEPWQVIFQQIVEKWYGKERRAGETFYRHPEKSHADIIHESKFHLEEIQLPAYTIDWTPEAIIGAHYSTSYGAKRFIEGHEDDFEREVYEALGGKVCLETKNLYVKVGWKRE